MSVHHLILNRLKLAYEENPSPGFDALKDLDDIVIIRSLFQNYRNSDGLEAGLRLSPTGQLIISNYFKQWKIKLTAKTFDSRDLLWLDRVCSLPWFMDTPIQNPTHIDITLYLMEAELAMRAKLVGDFNALKTAFA